MSAEPKLRSIGNGNRQANCRSGEDHCEEDQERDVRSSKVGGWNCGEGSDVEVKSNWHQRTHGRHSGPSDGTKPNVEQGYLQGYGTLILNSSPTHQSSNLPCSSTVIKSIQYVYILTLLSIAPFTWLKDRWRPIHRGFQNEGMKKHWSDFSGRTRYNSLPLGQF